MCNNYRSCQAAKQSNEKEKKKGKKHGSGAGAPLSHREDRKKEHL
jgi:hypothetical protein